MILDTVNDYINRGWAAPLPITAGAKYPPPQGMTGDIPELSRKAVESAWKGKPEDTNIGLRMQASGAYDIIGIDIDHYGEKSGFTHITDLQDELGPLPLSTMPICSRRGMESHSGQRYFRVPKNIKWKNAVCQDVDVLQISHRYAVVYPSIVEGEQYIWFQDGKQIDIPFVSDLPILPPEWVEFLKKGRVTRLGSSKSSSVLDEGKNLSEKYRLAIDWLRDNIHGWDVPITSDNVEDGMSSQLRSVTDVDTLLEKFSHNSHDTMIATVHSAVMLSVEGHIGLKPALHRIKTTFISEVTSRTDSSRRSESQAEAEYQRALVGEVTRVATDVESGNLTITSDASAVALPNFFRNLVRDESVKRPDSIDQNSYSDDDYGHATAFTDWWGMDVLATDDKDERFAVWVEKTGRYAFRSTDQMFGHVVAAISSRLDKSAEQIEAKAEMLEAAIGEGQIEEPDTDPDDLRKAARKIRDRASRTRNTSTMRNILAQLPSMPRSSVERLAFDANPNILGGSNSETIDLTRIGEEPFVRPSRQSDLLTFSTAVAVQPNARSDVWDKFLDKHIPDLELRRFVQKVIGYSLEDGNPEKILPILWGETNTGKTAILEACKAALGDYGGTVPITKLFGSRDGAPNPELLSVMKRRMVTLSEVGSDETLSASALKRITGNDRLMARKNHSNDVPEQRPMFTPYMSTNSIPKISGGDAATKGRLLIMPFREQAKPGRTTFENDIVSNPRIQSAVLWWIIEGFQMYRQEGLGKETWPKAVTELSDEFMSGTSELHAFLDDELSYHPDSRVPVEHVWKAWERWCATQNMDRRAMGTKKEFYDQLKANGFQRYRTTFRGYENKVFCFKGVSLASK